MRKARKTSDTNQNKKACFATRLSALLEETNTTQETLAEHLGFARQQISSYKCGKTSPDIDTLIKIAKYFDVSIDYLLGVSKIKRRSALTRDMHERLGLSEKAITELERDVEHSVPMESNPNCSVFYRDDESTSFRFCKPTRGQIVSWLLEDDGDGYLDGSILYLLANLLAHKQNRTNYSFTLTPHKRKTEEEQQKEFDEWFESLTEEQLEDLENGKLQSIDYQRRMELETAQWNEAMDCFEERSFNNNDLFNLNALKLIDGIKDFKKRIEKKGIKLWML